jgi:outer membrane immunogenic protein
LVYGTGGIAYGKIQRSFSTSNQVNTVTIAGKDDDKAMGYRVGGGLEHKVSDNFSIGAQYLYTSLKDDDDFTARFGGANVPVSNPFIRRNANGTDMIRSSNRFNSHNVSVVTSFRF